MSSSPRLVGFALLASVLSVSPLWAQGRSSEPPPPARVPGAPAAVTAPAQPVHLTRESAEEKRQSLREVMRQYPPSLGRVLKSDPTLLTNQAYLAQYPMLASFLAANPEVAHNPTYYFDYVYLPGDERPRDAASQAMDLWRNTFEMVSVFVVTVFISGVVMWLIQTLLNHRRWLRVSKVQTEAHNKLLERFAGTNELLAYVQSPSGRRFLEAMPQAPDAAAATSFSAPVGRILLSVQVGVVLVAAGLGFQFVSGRVIDDMAQGLWVIGILAFALGVGFVMSGAASWVLSKRLGLFDPPSPIADRGEVR